jgi:hypothetical protein
MRLEEQERRIIRPCIVIKPVQRESRRPIEIIGNLDTIGSYSLTVQVTDSAGNSIEIEITINVEDL